MDPGQTALGPKMYLGLDALGPKMDQGLPALKYCVVPRAVSPWSKNVHRACCLGYIFVPGAVSSFYPGLADYDLRFNTFGCYHNILLTKHLIVVEVREAFIKKQALRSSCELLRQDGCQKLSLAFICCDKLSKVVTRCHKVS